jgi:hypothetical protein
LRAFTPADIVRRFDALVTGNAQGGLAVQPLDNRIG